MQPPDRYSLSADPSALAQTFAGLRLDDKRPEASAAPVHTALRSYQPITLEVTSSPFGQSTHTALSSLTTKASAARVVPESTPETIWMPVLFSPMQLPVKAKYPSEIHRRFKLPPCIPDRRSMRPDVPDEWEVNHWAFPLRNWLADLKLEAQALSEEGVAELQQKIIAACDPLGGAKANFRDLLDGAGEFLNHDKLSPALARIAVQALVRSCYTDDEYGARLPTMLMEQIIDEAVYGYRPTSRVYYAWPEVMEVFEVAFEGAMEEREKTLPAELKVFEKLVFRPSMTTPNALLRVRRKDAKAWRERHFPDLLYTRYTSLPDQSADRIVERVAQHFPPVRARECGEAAVYYLTNQHPYLPVEGRLMMARVFIQRMLSIYPHVWRNFILRPQHAPKSISAAATLFFSGLLKARRSMQLIVDRHLEWIEPMLVDADPASRTEFVVGMCDALRLGVNEFSTESSADVRTMKAAMSLLRYLPEAQMQGLIADTPALRKWLDFLKNPDASAPQQASRDTPATSHEVMRSQEEPSTGDSASASSGDEMREQHLE